MKPLAPPLQPRIDLLDTLRGSALVGILLVHSVEHWDFGRYPENSPAWLKALDQPTRDLVFFLFAGKAYGIFALLFGVSFFLILDRWSRRGIHVRGKFLWRLSLLAVLGYLHGVIFCGDVLLIIAVLGAPLAFLYPLSNRALAWISAALLLQIPSLWQTVQALFVEGYQATPPRHWAIYDQLAKVYSTGSFRAVTVTNLWVGQSSRIWWTIETGRYCQMIGLFVWGFLLGRAGILENPERRLRLAKRAFGWALIGFALVYPAKLHLSKWGLTGLNQNAAANLLSAYGNLAQLVMWASGFILLYHVQKLRPLLKFLGPYGRMSLSCYVVQGLIGVPVFYHYGLAMYQVLGPFYSALFGAGLVAAQCIAAHFWLRSFNYGPLEWIWRAATFLDFSTPLRKPSRVTYSVHNPA